MTDPHRTDKSRTEPPGSKIEQSHQPAAPVGASPDHGTNGPADGEVAPVKKLTAEEQMALYEKDLKENDWGHQPC